MPKRTLSHHVWLVSELKDPGVASDYLNEALRDSPQMFLIALRNVSEAWRMSVVATEAGIWRESLYKMLSKRGNPRLNTLHAVLGVLGLEARIHPRATGSGPSNMPKPSVARSYRHGSSKTIKVRVATLPYQNQNVAAEVWASIPSVPRNPEAPELLVDARMTSAPVRWKVEKPPVEGKKFLADVDQGLLKPSALLAVAEYANQRSSAQTSIPA